MSLQVVLIMAVAVFAITFLVFFKQVSSFLIEEAQRKVDISVYFKKDISEQRIMEIKDELLQKFAPQIKDASYISKEDAQEVFIQKHKDDPLYLEALESVENNPFLPSLNISAHIPSQYANIAGFFQADSMSNLVEKISYNKNKKVIDKLFSVTANVEKAGIALNIFLALLVFLITFNSIKLTILASKDEVLTGRLVGASKWFLSGPFLVQGILYGLFAVMIFNMAMFAVVLSLNPELKVLLFDFDLLNYLKNNCWILFLTQIGFSFLLGLVSSHLAVRKYLKV